MKYYKFFKRCMAYIMSITMTLTLLNGLTVLAKDDMGDDMGGYLWTFFNVEGGYEKIFFGYSEDGLVWQKLNKDSAGTPMPILANDAAESDKGVRDPHIIRSNDGTKYWILGTDLHAEGGGAGGSGWNQLSASKNIVVWESFDLVNWSEPRLVYSGFENAGCVWAPEAIYDSVNDDYVVYWSIRDNSLVNTEKNALRVYVCRTKDFTSFTTPEVWLSEDENSGDEVNIIDTTIVNDGEYYYRFSTSDWRTVIDRSKTLDTEDVFDVTMDRNRSVPNGSWERIVTRNNYTEAGFDRREGFTVYQLPDGRWCAMGDNSGYAAFVTDDLSKGKYTKISASFVDGKFRHGTVMRLTKEEDERIRKAFGAEYGGGTLDEEESAEPVLTYDFESDFGKKTLTDTAAGNDTADDGILYGNAAVVYDAEKNGNVLVLDGSQGTYGAFPSGFFDYRDTMTICMDVKSEMDNGNFFTFTYGKNQSAYDFLRIRGNSVRNAITTEGWQNEKEVSATGAATGEWQNVALVIDRTVMKLYINGKLVSQNQDTGILTSYLGTNLSGYLGRSMYDADAYFKGSFDNIRIYNRALDAEEILDAAGDSARILSGAVIGTAPDRKTALDYRGTDYHTCVYTKIDTDKNIIFPYVKAGTDIDNIPMYFDVLADSVAITVDGKAFKNGSNANLRKGAKVIFSFNNRNEEYSIRPPCLCNNSVLPGQYADPDIDFFDGKFWIFPTTDGYPGWSGTVFHAWSSDDMAEWKDEGIIMELANSNPGLNENGIRIASSGWAVKGSAWAPAIEKKNGRYYFYYCGKDAAGVSQIGVASSDRPEGPYTDLGRPLITVEKCRELGISMGQAIDPSVFTDDDGVSYITFGNGKAAIVKLGADMMSIDEKSMKQIDGLTDFRESVVVIKRDGKYHWTWTCDDANSPNYHVNYGVSDTLYGKITVIHRPLLAKNEGLGILGTGHQSMLHVKDGYGIDRYYIAYHRFYSPINIFLSGDGLGVHRETCIDEVTFDDDGYMNIVNPSHEGASIYMGEPAQPTFVPDKPDVTKEPDATSEPEATKEPDMTEPDTTEKPDTTKEPTPSEGPVPPIAEPTKTPDTDRTNAVGNGGLKKNVTLPKVKLKGKSSVKRGKTITIRVNISSPDGSKVKWSIDKKGKKLFKLVNKKQTKIKLKARHKKGKGTITVRYGKIKVSKSIKVK
ncbi:MAG: family 43 glycosylhydrolase [Lachnospiraceae bacterium]|nr:family 43 glycosylhydrolase [Lachnospiraceae bacterium]